MICPRPHRCKMKTKNKEGIKKEKEKSKDGLRDLWDKIKQTNICIIKVPAGEKNEKGPGNLVEEIWLKNFPNLGKKTNIQIQESQRVSNKMKPKRFTPRPIRIKMSKDKDKERLLKAAKEKQLVTYKGTPIRLSADTVQTRRELHDIFKMLKEKKGSSQEYSTQQSYHSELEI